MDDLKGFSPAFMTFIQIVEILKDSINGIECIYSDAFSKLEAMWKKIK
jgi:hypothetical protein